MPQMAEKTTPDAPPNCAVLPKKQRERFTQIAALPLFIGYFLFALKTRKS